MKLKKILNFGSKMRMAPYEAPRLAQFGSLAQWKKSFLAIRDGGRVVRFLGLPPAVSRPKCRITSPILLAPSWRLEMPSEVFLDVPEEPPSTQEQPWSDPESSQNKRKKLPK
jgi:hypothetical protein